MMDLFLTNMQLFTSQDINKWTGVICGLLWRFYQLFELFHSDGTHSLQSWWDANFCDTPNVFQWGNKIIYVLDEYIFRWIIPFKEQRKCTLVDHNPEIIKHANITKMRSWFSTLEISVANHSVATEHLPSWMYKW